MRISLEVYVRYQVVRVNALSTNISIGLVHGNDEFVHDITEFFVYYDEGLGFDSVCMEVILSQR